MQKSDFYFDLPKELIAQEPCEPRDAARLLCLGRASGELRHAVFRDLPGLLQPGDLLSVHDPHKRGPYPLLSPPNVGGFLPIEE